MATKRTPPSEPEPITWRDIHGDGEEDERHGYVWAPAQPLAGMSAWWVIKDSRTGQPGQGRPILVARAAARHRVGRNHGRPGRSHYAPHSGRFVDIGEYFRETDSRSRFNRTFVEPAHVRFNVRPDNVAMDSFRRLCGG